MFFLSGGNIFLLTLQIKLGEYTLKMGGVFLGRGRPGQVGTRVASPASKHRTTNEIERFFRAFQRLYTTRGGFHSLVSAKRELTLFVVVYVFIRQAGSGVAPIEQIVPQAKDMPLYQLMNDPFRYGLVHVCLPH